MPKHRFYKRPDGLYEAIRVIDGKRVAFRARTQSGVEEKMRNYKAKQDEKAEFQNVADQWWDELEPTLARNTLKSYLPAIRRAKERFNGVAVGKVTTRDVQAFVDDFSRGQRSQKVVTTQLQIVRQILQYAAIHGLTESNAAALLKPPRGLPRSYRMPPTAEEVSTIKDTAKDHLLPALIYYTGCRWGEALGLRFEDIDRKNKRISIKRSVYYESTRPAVKEPKTERGRRVVPLLDSLAALLPKKKSGYIFADDAGDLLWRSQATHLWTNWQKATGLTLTAHQVRHGYATALMEAGVEPKVASQLLGHAQLSTTMDIYTHVRSEAIDRAAAKMEGVF